MADHNSTNKSPRIFDGGSKKTGSKTRQSGIRLFAKQFEFVVNNYPGNTSILYRWLLDKFMTDPSMKAEFDSYLKQLRPQPEPTPIP